MFKKVYNLCRLIYFYCTDEENLVLHILEYKALEYMKSCALLEVSDTEELEDLLFHIKTYYDIPVAVKETRYPNMKMLNLKDVCKGNIDDLKETDEFMSYLEDVETQRAVERSFIFEHAKNLPFGFDL